MSVSRECLISGVPVSVGVFVIGDVWISGKVLYSVVPVLGVPGISACPVSRSVVSRECL